MRRTNPINYTLDIATNYKNADTSSLKNKTIGAVTIPDTVNPIKDRISELEKIVAELSLKDPKPRCRINCIKVRF